MVGGRPRTRAWGWLFWRCRGTFWEVVRWIDLRLRLEKVKIGDSEEDWVVIFQIDNAGMSDIWRDGMMDLSVTS